MEPADLEAVIETTARRLAKSNGTGFMKIAGFVIALGSMVVGSMLYIFQTKLDAQIQHNALREKVLNQTLDTIQAHDAKEKHLGAASERQFNKLERKIDVLGDRMGARRTFDTINREMETE